MLVVKRTSRMLCMVMVFLMAMTMVPMIQGTGKAYAATVQPQAARIELVNAPEGQEFYVGLDDEVLKYDVLWNQMKVRVIFRDGNEKVMDSYDYITIDKNRDIHAETKFENVDGNDDIQLEKGNNLITITYKETMFDEDTGEQKTLQTLKQSFTVKGVVFQGYDPALENGQNLKSEISTWGNQILFENGELWKIPFNNVQYEKKEGVKGFVTDVYNSIHINEQNLLTAENLDGKTYGTLGNVETFGKGYALQKDGKLHYVPYCNNDRGDRDDSTQKIEKMAENVGHCVPASDYNGWGIYYTIDHTGKAYRYQYNGYGKNVGKSEIEAVNNVTNIVSADQGGAYYLTEDNILKYFDSQTNKSKEIMSNVKRVSDYFATDMNGKTYSLDGQKLLDIEVVDEKKIDYNKWCIADASGNLYLYVCSDVGEEEPPVYTTYMAATDYKKFSTYGYITTDGTEKGLPYWDSNKKQVVDSDVLINVMERTELRTDGTVYVKGNRLLTNITSLGYCYPLNVLIMARKDGTIWLFNSRISQIATPQKISQKLLDEISYEQSWKRDINELAFSYQREMTFTGKEIKPAVTIQDYDYILKQGTDYDLTYKNNINVGSATIIVVGKGDYMGTRNLTFTIKEAQNKPASPNKKNQLIQGAGKFIKTYGSKPFYLRAKTTGNGKLTYKSNNRNVIRINQAGKATIKAPGRAIVTVTAAATTNYNAATKQVLITVKPKKIAGLKVKAAKKKMTVGWKRDPKADGYQLTYAQNSKFKKGKKNVLIRKNKTTKTVIKKVKPKETYYVKARAYKKVGKKNLYGAYSKVRKVKIKQ